jgi:isopentenyl-diphosphate delta-isomerase
MPAPNPWSPVDWVDEADRPVKSIERGRVFEAGAKFRVVHIFVFNPQGDLLLQQLGRERERNPLKWGSSVAGYLHAGEAYADGATRRLREELGLEAPLVKHGSISMQDRSSTKFITLYKTHTAEEPQILEASHIESLRFWSLGELEEDLAREPEQFTETFRYVLRFYLATSRLAAE